MRRLTAGGTEGNERLTVVNGILLIVLLAALGVTIVRIGQLLWLHLFLGLLLIGPIALKLISTGYRFARYYTSDPAYRRKGPPAPALRALAPLVVLLTLIVFASGVVLLLIGPSSRGTLLLVHKASFIGWLAVTAVHVIAHLPEVGRLLATGPAARREMNALRINAPGEPRERAQTAAPERVPGGSGRVISIALSLFGGLVIATALIPWFAAWTHAAGGH